MGLSEQGSSFENEEVVDVGSLHIRPASQRDAKEVPVDVMDINDVWNFMSNNVTIRQSDLGGRPIVLTKQQFFELDGELTVRYVKGGDYTFEIDNVSDEGITILPEDLTD